MRDNEPWFVLMDVCACLGMVSKGATSMTAGRVEEEDKDDIILNDTVGRPQKVIVVNESALYEIVIRSDKPLAKPFRRWVTREVLPSIRKTGGYGCADVEDGIELTPEMMHAFADAMARVREIAPKAAAHDRVMEVDGGWYVTTVARMFNMRPSALYFLLREWGGTYLSGGTMTRASTEWVENGWLKRRGPGTPMVTEEGLRELERRFDRKAIVTPRPTATIIVSSSGQVSVRENV